jgi:hypothetical protein
LNKGRAVARRWALAPDSAPLGHWFAEHHAHDNDHLGPDATVEITINPR